MKKRTEYLIYLSYSAICAAIIAASAWIALPFSAIPVTLQSFAICAVAGLLGWKWGLASLSVYVLLGAVGLPVFSGFGGGIGVLMGASGGYIIGFFTTVLIVGIISNKYGGKFVPMLISMSAGILACYAVGTLWFVFVYSSSEGFLSALAMCVAPFVIPDAVKIIAAALVVSRLKPHLMKDI